MGASTGAHGVRDLLSDFTQDRRLLLLSGMALIIGAVSALVAYILVWLIGAITNLAFFGRFSADFISPAGNHLGPWAILVPVVGGLIIGPMARYGSEAIRGHGIPEALEAILIGRSRMSAKVAVLKPLSSAISIGTGGPFGAEGPIIMTGGAFGSLFAQLFDFSAIERRTLLAAGAAGGMAAIFAAPVAAAMLAVELLLFEWRPRSFIPAALAALVAAALRVPLLGAGPIFPAMPHAMLSASELLVASGVGLVSGLGSGLLTAMVYGVEDLFNKLPIHWMWWPAIGGLVVGVGGLINPAALGVGYDTIRLLVRGELVAWALISLLLVKAVIWSVALGSGTSGGILAPLLIIGGALGALEAHFIPIGDPGLWAMIGMAAMMGGAMRLPFTATIFALEVTHDLSLLPALLAACIVADGCTVLLLRRSILTEKVARRGRHLRYEYGVDVADVVRVGEMMDTSAPTIPATMKVRELVDRILQGDVALTRQAFPILDEGGHFAGLVTQRDLLSVVNSRSETQFDLTVMEAGRSSVTVAYPDELLRDAVVRMLRDHLARLPVVTRDCPPMYLGYLGRAEVLGAQLRQFEEEQREPGWLRHVFCCNGPQEAAGGSATSGNRYHGPKMDREQ